MSTNKSSKSPKINNSKKFEDAINEYYDLKQQYKLSKDKDIQTFLEKNEKLSWREKRNLFKSLNYKCVNCKRYVGSIFKINLIEEDRHLIAKCGDHSNPCPLKIDINLGVILSYNEGIELHKELILDNKQSIIRDKNNLMFGYISSKQAIDKFDKLKDELASNINILEITKKAYLGITNDLAKKEQIILLQQQIYVIIHTIKVFIKQYESTNNPVLIDDAVKLYTEELINKLKEINVLSFAYKEVEYNLDLNTYTLIEKQYSVEQMEINIGLNNEVISFITGLGDAGLGEQTEQGTVIGSVIGSVNKKGKKTKAKSKAQLATEEAIINNIPDKFGPNASPNAKKTRAPRKQVNPVKNKTIKRVTKKTVGLVNFEIESDSDDSNKTIEVPAIKEKTKEQEQTKEQPKEQTKEQHYNEIDWSASSNDSIEIEAKGIPLISDHANEVPIIDLDIIELPNEIESQESISEKSQKNLFE